MPARLTTHDRDEQGLAMVLVLVIALLLVGSLAVALKSSTANLNYSSRYGSSTQAALASNAGLDAAIQAIRNADAFELFPCVIPLTSLSAPGATSTYTVTAQYTDANGIAIPCSGSNLGGATAPAAATLVSTGKAPQGNSTVMKASLHISPVTDLGKALTYSIFTQNNVTLQNNGSLNQTAGNPPPNVFAGQLATCNNPIVSAGGLTTDQSLTLSQSCTFLGDVSVVGSLTMLNSSVIGGDATAYGGDITMSDSATIGTTGKNDTATATGCPSGGTGTLGNINVTGSQNLITGKADAYGVITTKNAGNITVTPTTQNDATLQCKTAPPSVTFPGLNPSLSDWANTGWSIIQVPSVTYPTCNSYFQGKGPDPFTTAISQATTKTVIYAPTCDVTYSGTTFSFSSDVALEVQTFTLANQNNFQSTSLTVHRFAVLASVSSDCSTSSTDVTIGQQANLLSSNPLTNASMEIFIYTEGQVNYANQQGMNGLIFACGGFVQGQQFTLNFVPDAALSLPWNPPPDNSPTATVLRKFVLSG